MNRRKFIQTGLIFVPTAFAGAQGLYPSPSLPTRGLVGHWKMDYLVGGTTVWDASAQSNHGTLQGGMSSANLSNAAHSGQALSFDGISAYVGVGNTASLDIAGDITLAAWINTNTIATGPLGIISSLDSTGVLVQWQLEINRVGGRVGFVHGGVVGYILVNGNTNLTTGRWHHVAAVRTGSSGNWTITFYLNGIADGAPTDTPNPAAHQIVAIGRPGDIGCVVS